MEMKKMKYSTLINGLDSDDELLFTPESLKPRVSSNTRPDDSSFQRSFQDLSRVPIEQWHQETLTEDGSKPSVNYNIDISAEEEKLIGDFTSQGSSGVFVAILNFVNSIIGAGLFQPYIMP